MADRIVVMNEGEIEQEGTPAEVYDRPATPFVFNFLGNVNLFHGRVHQGLAQMGGMELASPAHAATTDSPAVGYVRSHDIEVERQPCSWGITRFEKSKSQTLMVFHQQLSMAKGELGHFTQWLGLRFAIIQLFGWIACVNFRMVAFLQQLLVH